MDSEVTYVHATTLEDATRFRSVLKDRIAAHAKICRDCTSLARQANRYCPDGWELAKQYALASGDVDRLSGPVLTGQGVLF